MLKQSEWLFESLLPYEKAKTRNNLRVKKKIYEANSPYQKIEVYDTYKFGKVLVLDGIFQTSEKDEFIYHEMLCHLPMLSHVSPRKVLIIGGGDGGALEEVLKYPVEKVWLAEIDEKVIEVSKKYLPAISRGAFNSKKLKIVIGDGWKFAKNHRNFFDVIILDLSDPLGPAEKLISIKFYQDIKKALKKNGVISVQSGSLTFQPRLVALINRRLKKVFSFVAVHAARVPLYRQGLYGFTLAANFDLKKINLLDLKRRFNKLSLKTKYYSPKVHLNSLKNQ